MRIYTSKIESQRYFPFTKGDRTTMRLRKILIKKKWA